MKADEFPKATLLQALKDTKKIKTNMKPFIAQYSQYNMPWLMQTVSTLFHNLTNQQTKPLLKMNSMFAVKCIVESCQYAAIAFVEAYIFPIIREGAFVDTNEPEDQRGADFFEVKDGDNEDDVINYGYNYILLCTELVKVLAVIKPRKLFYDQQTQDISDFELTNLELKKALKQSSDQFNQLKFFKEKPADLNRLYNTKVGEFEQKRLEVYQKFIENVFKQQLQAQFVPKKDSLDIRRLIQLGDQFIYQNILEYVGNVISSDQPSCRTVWHALGFISDMVKTGHLGVAFFMHNNDCIKEMVKEVINIPNQSKDLNRGVNYLPRYKGTPQDHKKLYHEFLKHLDYWGQTYLSISLKSPSSADEDSNLAKYLQILKKNQYQFPKNPLLENQLKQTHANFQKNKNLNKRLKQEVINQIMPEEDNSAIIIKSMKEASSKKQIDASMSKSKSKIEQNSQKSIEKIQMNPPPSSHDVDQKSLKSARERIKRIERAIELLTQNEKLLPENIKTINTQLEEVTKLIEEGDLQQNTLEQLIEKQEEINEKMEKIRPVYEQYKTNKIDYKKFCQLIAPLNLHQQIPLQSIHEVEEPISKIQQVPKEKSNNSIPIESRKTIQKQQVTQSRASIPAKKQQSSHFILQKQPEKIKSNQNLDNKQLVHSKVNFSQSGLEQSKFTQNLPQKPQDHHRNGLDVDYEVNFEPVAFMTRPGLENQRGNQMVSPIRKIHYQQPEEQYDNSQNDAKSFIKGSQKQSRLKSQYSQELEQEQYIQNPSLMPLDNSFHDLEQIYQQSRKSKSFKQAISNDKLFIKTNKKQNMFKMSEECRSIVKPVVNPNKSTSRVSSKINVPELLNQRSRKYEVEMKLLQENKDKEIRQLMMKLNKMERQNSHISEELRAKQVQIRSLKQNSQADQARSRAVKSSADQFSLVDDQNFLLKKKFNVPNTAYNFKKTGENFKNQSRMLATGQLIESKPYEPYFSEITDQKAKKMFMKNKQLLYKSNEVQIGSIGQLKGGVYSITIFITPEKDYQLKNIKAIYDENIEISHDFEIGETIGAKRQLRKLFQIRINNYPYKIPEVQLEYMLQERKNRIHFFLPCAFHKFFTIKNVFDQAQFNREFDGNIIRGQQIPYSRKILKSIDLLQDFLPNLQKLNRGEPNQKGQICFGGLAAFYEKKFPVKISVKPNQFLYIQAITSEDPQLYRLISFYIATLNHFLIKNVDWN